MDHAVGQALAAVDELGLREAVVISPATTASTSISLASRRRHRVSVPMRSVGFPAGAVPRSVPGWQRSECADRVGRSGRHSPPCAICRAWRLLTGTTALLRGEGEPVRDVAVTEFAWAKSITDGRYRMVHYPDKHPCCDNNPDFGELYDLETDPGKCVTFGTIPITPPCAISVCACSTG